MEKLIEERTGAKPGTVGGMFKLNPKVDDIPEGLESADQRHHSPRHRGSRRSPPQAATVPRARSVRMLLKHLVLETDEVTVVDMEAGIEHLDEGYGRVLVDAFIVVVEPGQRSVQTANTVKDLAKDWASRRSMSSPTRCGTTMTLHFWKAILRTWNSLAPSSSASPS
ncbi:MAG: hypothetical protein MZV70_35895 [Desulfobacterales bacterium]|nr:hypothetical protein [Desulfobacterales bacterium]